MSTQLMSLAAGQMIPYGGDRVAVVPAALAAEFVAGDRLIVVQETGDLLRVPAAEAAVVAAAVERCTRGFAELAACTDAQISDFFDRFAALLDDDAAFAPIAAANATDVETARDRGRSTTRLELTDTMRADMAAGLRGWRDAELRRDEVTRLVEHDGWSLEQRRAPLGVVGFVFEGRPNVFADACGVVRTGNTVVFRIGSDALGTARAIVEHALAPALAGAGLPEGAVQLVDSPSRAAGHALFSDRRLSLAVARGSGPAVAQLGAVAAQHGINVSLHGTGGAWMVADESADADALAAAVEHSLDRKVCNTLNVCAVVAARAGELVPVVLGALRAAGRRRDSEVRLHVVHGAERFVPSEWFETQVEIGRADGVSLEPRASRVEESVLATEWEWETAPEITLVVVPDLDAAVALCNRYSPHFTASLVAEDRSAHARFFASVDAPFVGDGMTRWVDGQYALGTPELGLSNWEFGRMLGRGAILSGDSMFTLRYRARIADTSLRR